MGEIKLSREFEAIIQRHIESGHYQNAQDVIAAGLSLLDAFEGTELTSEGFAAAINQSLDDGSDDIPLESAFEHIETIYLRDVKARG